VEETDFDRLHSEQQTQGENKYSTIQKVCTYTFGVSREAKITHKKEKNAEMFMCFQLYLLRAGSFSMFVMNIEEDQKYELFSTVNLSNFGVQILILDTKPMPPESLGQLTAICQLSTYDSSQW
jgi:hypothetical protein